VNDHGARASAPLILGIETSCDDTCAAVVDGAGNIRSNVIASQHVHDRFGGVVPEIASRHHLELAGATIDEALAQAGVGLDAIDRVAVTQGPGLVGALLVGVATAKALAIPRGLPLVPVDHLQGHVAANWEGSEEGREPFPLPFLCLIASGGHTLLARVEDHSSFAVLGRTLDDAAGEAFDKGARLLGLGYPGGPALERLARDGDAHAFSFPIGAGRAGGTFAASLDFSFAGIKTSLLYRVRELGEGAAERRADLAASYQWAVVEALARRTERALQRTGLERLAVGGGVAANGPLRTRLAELGVPVHIPPRELCTDNAAMIARAALHLPALDAAGALALDAYATGERSIGVPSLRGGPPFPSVAA
jgi:N6-L-threonylcarbamoyladenine synthase